MTQPLEISSPRVLGAALLPRMRVPPFEISTASFGTVAESEINGNKHFDSGVGALG